MPACSECAKLVNERCSALQVAEQELQRDINPTAGCIVAIVEQYVERIQHGMRILDIGCGSWSRIRDRCSAVGAHYEAIDIQTSYYGVPTIATRIESIRDLSFPDQSFDLVIANQSMEHWAEFGCPIDWGLRQCFRVCKVGGFVLLNVPIHFHGSRDFLLGDIQCILDRVRRFSPGVISETWREDARPLAPFFGHQEYKVLVNKPAFVLAIEAQRTNNRLRSMRPPTNLPVAIRRSLNYPLSFNIFRLYRHVRALFGRRRNSMRPPSGGQPEN